MSSQIRDPVLLPDVNSRKTYVNHQVVNSTGMVAWSLRFLITRGCLLLIISSSCSWQRKISWCRLVKSSAAHVDRNCCVVSLATSFRANIRAHVVRAVSYALVIWFPFLTLWRSF